MYGETTKVYVKFGPGETDEMPKEWAEAMLTAWRESDPRRFGAALAAVVTSGHNGHKER